jgi:hypothetical protein
MDGRSWYSDLKPARRAFRCAGAHECIALADIEVPLRGSGYPLDANGFRHDRMVRLLIGIRDDVSLPAVYIERGDPHQRPYRVREGVHRYHASLALGFSMGENFGSRKPVHETTTVS